MAFDPSTSILVVDQRDAELRILRALLRQLGFVDVDDARDSAEAFTRMRGKRYGLVISDWHTQPMTGCELVREARSEPRFHRTPFIVTGESRPENVIAAKKAGANSYIVKPFNAEMLKAKIEAAFATRTTALPERQPSPAASQPPRHGETSEATSTSGDGHQKFDGLFTSSL